MLNCKYCNSKYNQRDRGGRSKFCSDICKSKSVSKTLSDLAKQRHKDGKHIGWQTRNKLSYPEKFFKKVLELNGFNGKFKINYPINKRELGLNEGINYFLDFYFPELNLDLEIDGKQHNYPDRIVSDKLRDQILNDNGINVYRIKWKSINNSKGKVYIKNEIIKLLSIITK